MTWWGTAPTSSVPTSPGCYRPHCRSKQYTFPRFESPKFVDWVDYADRNAKASPDAYAQGLLKRAAGHTIWMVYSTGYKTLEGKCEAILNSLASRPEREPRDARTTRSTSSWA